jgi:hypothetical protein
MDQRVFCPHCQGAYDPAGRLCLECGGAIPDEAWSAIERPAGEATLEGAARADTASLVSAAADDAA